MKFTTNDELLDEELQELYILSSHWSLNIGFAEGELRFLRKVIHIFFVGGVGKNGIAQDTFSSQLLDQEAKIISLKVRSATLLKAISPLIGNKNPKIGLEFLEKFSTLENDIKQLAEDVKEIKTSLFTVVEKMIKLHVHGSPVNEHSLTENK